MVNKCNIRCFVVSLITLVLIVVFMFLVYYNTAYKQSFIGNDRIKYKVLAGKKDKSEAIVMLSNLNKDTMKLMEYMKNKYEYLPDTDKKKEAINLIIRNYNPDLLTENHPVFTIGDKTYTENMKKISICLRHKDGTFYDYNTLLFVFLHEIAHVGTHHKYLERGDPHTEMFWRVFKFLLVNANEIKLIKPIDYKENGIIYCGTHVKHNPLFDYSIDPL